MTYFRTGDEIREIRPAPSGGFGRIVSKTAIHPKGTQYCCPESDRRLMEIVRALDERELLIVAEEVMKRCEAKK